jgi:hypothetical protein
VKFLWLWFDILPRIKIWKKLEMKYLLSATTKRTTSGQSNVTETRAEERVIVTKNRQQKMTSVIVAS